MLKLQPNRHEIFHGAWLRSCEADGFAVSETVCASGVELTRHSHERAGFCAVLQGGFVEYRQGRERLYQQSDILFRPPGELHANRFQTTGGRCLNIEIADKQLTRMGAHARVFGRPADYVDQRLSQLIMRIYRELQQDDDVAALAIEALTLELLIEAARRAQPPVKQPKWLSKVEELLHERFAESPSLDEIAAAVDVHPAHLVRTFRGFHQQTVGDYIRHLRIQFARTQLSNSSDPISVIAIAAGFYDQSHFNRAFKLHTGMTPVEYRSTFRQRSSGTKSQSQCKTDWNGDS